jgi:hypothetical protein
VLFSIEELELIIEALVGHHPKNFERMIQVRELKIKIIKYLSTKE